MYNNSKYIFKKNLQNDIIGIYDSSNNLVARYEYDAWGNHKVYDQNGNLNTTSYFIGNVNPFRYRSYYYDRETNLYYCYARYYNPDLCRWMSLDSLEYLEHETLNGMNLYAYCNNDPINFSDPEGHLFFSALIIGAFVGAAIGAGVSAITQLATDDHKIDPMQVVLDGSIGAVSGLLAATGIGAWASACVSGALGFAGSVAGDLIQSKGDVDSIQWGKAVVFCVLGLVNFGLGKWAGAGSQNSSALGKGLLKNKEVSKTFTTLYNATTDYAANAISKRGLAGVFNLHGKKFISAVADALPSTVAKLTAINLGKLGISSLISGFTGSLFK